MEIFSPLLIVAFGLLHTVTVLRTRHQQNKSLRNLHVAALHVAARLGLRVEPGREHFRVYGAIAGRPVEAQIFAEHCRARARFAVRLLPQHAVISLDDGYSPAPAPSPDELPPWLELCLRAQDTAGLTLYADRLGVRALRPSTAESVVELLLRAVALAAALERARPEARLR